MKRKLSEQTAQLKRHFSNVRKQLQEEELERENAKRRHKNELDKQMTEIHERKQREEFVKELEKQIRKRKNLSLIRAEMEEKENERKSREELKQGIKDYLESEEEIRKRRREMERVENEMRRIYREVAETLEKKRKTKEKVFDSKLKISNLLLFEKLIQEAEDEVKRTNENIKTQWVEKDEKKQEELVKYRKRREELRRERIADRERSEEETKKKREERKLTREREVSERVERQRCDRIWNEGERRKDWERKLRTRMALTRQREENEERRKEEDRWRKLHVGDLEKDNEDVVAYCDYVLEEAKKCNRPLFPILTAVKNVKTECGILKPTKNIDHLKSKIPIDQ